MVQWTLCDSEWTNYKEQDPYSKDDPGDIDSQEYTASEYWNAFGIYIY